MSRALITGITGQDGSYLAELLLRYDYEVVGFAQPEPAADRGNIRPILDQLMLVEGDLLRPESIRAAVAGTTPDEVYHLAAPTFIPDSWGALAETTQAIAVGTAVLLEAVRDHCPAARVVVAASSDVFGDAGVSPQREDTPMRPNTPYGVAKLAGYGLARAVRRQYGLHVSNAIMYNHESPRRPERFLPRKVARAAAAISLGRQYRLQLGDLDAIRDWSDARDIVDGLWRMARAEEAGDFVLACGVGRTVQELADVAFRRVGLSAADYVDMDPALVRPRDGSPRIGDASLARDVLCWKPRFSFEEMIGEMVDSDLASMG